MEEPSVTSYTCSECKGAVDPPDWARGSDWVRTGVCFTCMFWLEKCEPALRDDPNTARINGQHYIIGDERAGPEWRGFSGRRWVIEFNDGRRVETTNLWAQGSIPLAFHERLPNNARFIEREEYGA